MVQHTHAPWRRVSASQRTKKKTKLAVFVVKTSTPNRGTQSRPAACNSKACIQLATARSPKRSRRSSLSELRQNTREVGDLISAKMRSSFLCPALGHPVRTKYHTVPPVAADTHALSIKLEATDRYPCA